MQLFGLAAFLLGVALAIFAWRAPPRGSVGLALLIIAALAWALIELGDSAQPSHLSIFLTFLFVAPVAITYSLRSRKNAPDRWLALAAFAGAFIVAAFLVFMLARIIASLLGTR